MASYGYQTHVITAGDSLQKIAVMYNISDWREIAHFNKLVYPYISNDMAHVPQSGVANIGDLIYIPSYDYQVAPIADELDPSILEEQAYGCDLDVYTSIDDNGKAQNLETKGELSGHNGDIKLIKGINNLRQQLTIKLSTRKGTLMLHPEWGCNLLNMVGTKGTEENLIDMMLMVKECFLEDFRVVNVSDLVVTKDAEKVIVSCKIQPISPYPEFYYNETISEE